MGIILSGVSPLNDFREKVIMIRAKSTSQRKEPKEPDSHVLGAPERGRPSAFACALIWN